MNARSIHCRQTCFGALAVVLSICLLAVAQDAKPQPAGELPRDPNNVYGQFDNGFSYIVRHNANPPGKVALNLHVKTGSINESEQQNGLAHFIEHMAFNGSTNFKPGELIPLMSKLGMVFGADSNAHTTLHETVYKLTMPDTKPETIDLAMKIFADYANGLQFGDDEISSERGVILEEKRSHLSVDERMRKMLMQQVFADTQLARHDVIGDEETLKTIQRSEFVDYWDAFYRPENMTLVVVGDIDPQLVIAQAKDRFGSIKGRGESRQAAKAGLKPTQSTHAFIFTDPEQVSAEVGFMSMKPARPPTTTEPQLRQSLVDDLGNWIVNRRFDEIVRSGGAPFRDATVDNTDFIGEAMIMQAQGEGEPKDWNKILDAVVAEVNRAIDHGFTDREVELAKSDRLSNAERAVQTESTRDSNQIVGGLSGAIGLKRPIMSAQQRLDFTKKFLGEINKDELHKAFVSNFKSNAYNYILSMPSNKEGLKLPSQEDVLAAASAAWAKKTEAPEDQKLAGSILASEPDAGKVASSETDKDLEITTVTFENDVVMHHKFTDYKKDQVTIRITLPGGAIEETPDNKGISEVASLIAARPATSRFTSSQVRDLMTGKKVSVRGSIGLDTLSLGVSGSPAELPLGMQLAYAILTDGRLEQSALDEWKKTEIQLYERKKTSPEGQIQDAFAKTIYGGDFRMLDLTPEQIARQERSPAEAWFKRIAGNAAIEVAMVGDIKLDDAQALVAKYVGSLPKRTGKFDDLNPLRKITRGAGPYKKSIQIKAMADKAFTLAGFISCDELDPERRPLTLASQILTERMNDRIREKEQLVYSIQAFNLPGKAIPHTGIMCAAAPTDPKNANKLADVVIEMFKDFADKGPTEEELATAKKQTLNTLKDQMKEPSYWLAQISEMAYRGKPLSQIKEMPAIYETFSVSQVQGAVKKFLKDDSIVKIEIVPEGTEKGEIKPDAKPESEPAPKPTK
ncbi:insulinase family protein [soil metagenome]